MKNDSIVKTLREQIKELRVLVELKEQRIQELERLRVQPVFIPSQPISVPSPWIQQPFTITCQHEYPINEITTDSSACIKCGQPRLSQIIISTNIAGVFNTTYSHGNVQSTGYFQLVGNN